MELTLDVSAGAQAESIGANTGHKYSLSNRRRRRNPKDRSFDYVTALSFPMPEGRGLSRILIKAVGEKQDAPAEGLRLGRQGAKIFISIRIEVDAKTCQHRCNTRIELAGAIQLTLPVQPGADGAEAPVAHALAWNRSSGDTPELIDLGTAVFDLGIGEESLRLEVETEDSECGLDVARKRADAIAVTLVGTPAMQLGEVRVAAKHVNVAMQRLEVR
jgi:hypothetical protein